MHLLEREQWYYLSNIKMADNLYHREKNVSQSKKEATKMATTDRRLTIDILSNFLPMKEKISLNACYREASQRILHFH